LFTLLRFCSQQSPVRRYLADSAYYLFLAHLPLVFFLQVVFAKVPLHWTVKFPLIFAIALTVLLVSYPIGSGRPSSARC
jgi:glucan biosynthesis protein C